MSFDISSVVLNRCTTVLDTLLETLTPTWRDLTSPVWRSRLQALAARNQLVRYDCRGCGLSDRQVPGFSFELALSELETVVDAAGLERFSHFGSSQGAGVAIA